jgi:group I intron endonuclease
MEMIGIYIIQSTSTGASYIGQSTDVLARIKYHEVALRNSSHKNYKLLEAYSLGSLIFEVLEECSTFELDTREVFWIEEFEAYTSGYNLTKGGANGRPFGYSNSQYTKEQIVDSFKLLLAKYPQKDITKVTGVSVPTLNHIRHGERHQYLSELFPEEWKALTSTKVDAGRVYSRIENVNTREVVEVHSCKEVASNLLLDPSKISKILRQPGTTHKGWRGCL